MHRDKLGSRTIALVVGLVLMLVTGLLPPFEGLSVNGMRTLGIFAGTIIMWLFVATDWPCLITMAALIISGVLSYQKVIEWSWGHWVTIFALTSFLLGAGLQATGWTKRAATWFITRPITRKSPWLFLTLFFLGCLAVANLTMLPAYFVFMLIAQQIFEQCGYKQGVSGHDKIPKNGHEKCTTLAN